MINIFSILDFQTSRFRIIWTIGLLRFWIIELFELFEVFELFELWDFEDFELLNFFCGANTPRFLCEIPNFKFPRPKIKSNIQNTYRKNRLGKLILFKKMSPPIKKWSRFMKNLLKLVEVSGGSAPAPPKCRPKGLRNVGLWASPGLRLRIAVG